jgi:hypothetical protein
MLAALAACLAGLWFLWSRGMQAAALALLVVTFAVVFFLGRRMEDERAAQWEQAAQAMQATYLGEQPAAWLARFGSQAPWISWASDGELVVRHVADGGAQPAPFWLLQLRYSQRERRGEEHPDSWYEVTVAVVRAAGKPQPAPAGEGYAAVRDAQYLFVWKKGSPGPGASLDAGELPGLLHQARLLAGASAAAAR